MFRALCFVTGSDRDEGWILEYQGAEFVAEVENTAGTYLGDHNHPPAPRNGLLIFEGFIEVESLVDDEADVYWRGKWRDLTHWEMLRVREGDPPWEEG